MKKLFALFSLALVVLFGCSTPTKETTSSKTVPTVTVTTSFLNDIVKQLAGDFVKHDTIIPAGEDPHLYQAKSSDLDKIKKADLVLYHGLHFEGKMVDVLEKTGSAVTKNFPKDKLETLDQDGETVTDPHFWFDISLYKLAVENTAQELIKLVPTHKEAIEKNTTAYLKQLDELQTWVKAQLEQVPEHSRYLITPHDAFNYFAKSYDFNVHAPQGISTSSEVDNKAMIETVDLIIKQRIKAIFSESTTNPERMKKLKEAVQARGSNVEVVGGDDKELFSDSLAPQGQYGDTYIDMYKHNVKLITDYLK